MKKAIPEVLDQSPTDQELILRMKSGELDAFDILVERYQKRLYRVIYGVLLHHEDTNDVLMETFIKAYKNIGGFRIGASFYTWIYRIAINTAISFKRKSKFNPQPYPYFPDDEEGQMEKEFVDYRSAEQAVRQMEIKELNKVLNDALSKLSEKHRAVVVLFDLEELSHSEIAKIMGCSEGTIRSRLFYAHKQLQKLLKNDNSFIS
ncbi:RNA polymerase subunit sigma [Candidatus Methylacidiphilum fumarolicum]|uniref:DNA-directed RNA polymerase subunit sigma n=3 Tax=Methylacidiphilum (ex Ratnadevi et al. 2023) TaxID=511745 RepID=A0A0C1RL33_9BACT|nr:MULTISPECIES: sigma-70 family RNA polymerase sigma factor [Methylacidiphilum (ex Ratnadevi et al. 2023)]KIE58742.1 DNA-directed RNA polymerase subunit sigma [Methylacidiphilum kamchatkense Kam1]MBW6415181.1 sigma-70 family RNA polymerase sigma factor [Candidatus Methylacidiphilum fumarolicum]QDQ41860.1 RNA polymerase sigma-70 factor (ECF subfamily) [Methylacidiphilum kamchatkense Kam1]TFE65942.1 RNA polymerase subunit sigma [Candidatus Methylacidiphilum fumarolicum]TFE72676.1 RNA polymerase